MAVNQMLVDSEAGLLEALQEKENYNNWFSRLRSFFDQQFGYPWRIKHKDLLERYDELMRDWL